MPPARLRHRAGPRAGRTILVLATMSSAVLTAACSGGRDAAPAGPEPSTAATAGPTLRTTTTVRTVVGAGGLRSTRRAELKAAVARSVDTWIDAAYLGTYPRTDFGDAFTVFTSGAADRARHDEDLMSNAALGERLASVTARTRRLRLDVLVVRGTPTGVTAHVTLGLDLDETGATAGAATDVVRDHVVGRLYLTHRSAARGQPGRWQVFGYDVRRGLG